MADADEAGLYPIFLKLARRKVLVVGAGPIAERKIASLVEVNATVVVVAPRAVPEVERMARAGLITWHARRFDPADADGASLIVAATSDVEVQRSAALAAATRHLFVLAVDDLANATAYSGAILRRPPFTVAISSSGATPALTRLLRELIDEILPAEDWVEHAKRLRADWLASRTPPGERFGQLVRAFAARASRSGESQK